MGGIDPLHQTAATYRRREGHVSLKLLQLHSGETLGDEVSRSWLPEGGVALIRQLEPAREPLAKQIHSAEVLISIKAALEGKTGTGPR